MVEKSPTKNLVPIGGSTEPEDIMLINILKSYYRLCRNSTDKTPLIKDETLLNTLSSCVRDGRPQVSLYTCKILLALSKENSDAKKLNDNSTLKSNISLAMESGELPPQILKGLIIVQSRLTTASLIKNLEQDPTGLNNVLPSNPRKSVFFSKPNKQYVFLFNRPTESQKRQIEKCSLNVAGVVSVCFQSDPCANESQKTNCVIRCRENVEAKTIINKLFASNAGFDVIQMYVQLPDGSKQIFDFYPEEAAEKQVQNLPKYLDENVEIFNPDQCVITKEQLEKQSKPGWFPVSISSLKFW